MSDLRKAAQMALEALEIASRNGSDGLKRYEIRELDDTIAELRAALAQERSDVQPEPVCDKDPQGCWSVRCQLGKVCKNAPPQRKPLTEEEIEYIAPVSFTWRDMVTFARNVECEHGIGNK